MKTKVKYQLIPIKMAVIRKTDITSVSKLVGRQNLNVLMVEMHNGAATLEKFRLFLEG